MPQMFACSRRWFGFLSWCSSYGVQSDTFCAVHKRCTSVVASRSMHEISAVCFVDPLYCSKIQLLRQIGQQQPNNCSSPKTAACNRPRSDDHATDLRRACVCLSVCVMHFRYSCPGRRHLLGNARLLIRFYLNLLALNNRPLPCTLWVG